MHRNMVVYPVYFQTVVAVYKLRFSDYDFITVFQHALFHSIFIDIRTVHTPHINQVIVCPHSLDLCMLSRYDRTIQNNIVLLAPANCKLLRQFYFHSALRVCRNNHH